MLSPAEIETLVQHIVARLRPQKVIIFGSYAKGAATIRSDLDLFVIKETELPMAHRAADLRPLFDNRLIPVDLHVYTPEEVEAYARDPLSFVSSVLRTGKVVFDATPTAGHPRAHTTQSTGASRHSDGRATDVEG